jgi:predicted transcriptional regulator
LAAEAEAVLRLLGHIVQHRSVAEWRVLDLLTPGVRGQQKAVAQELGITTQAVSKALARAQWVEEHAARPAAARLLQMILEVR